MSGNRLHRIHAMAAALMVPAFVHAAPLEPQSASKPNGSMSRDQFINAFGTSLNKMCDNPQSPYACIAKTPELCRQNLPLALDRCRVSLSAEMPETILAEERRKRSEQAAHCVVDNYLDLLGEENSDMSKCRQPGTK
jgi:hypothetical protein